MRPQTRTVTATAAHSEAQCRHSRPLCVSLCDETSVPQLMNVSHPYRAVLTFTEHVQARLYVS
jgi:hypothetical protein